MVIADRGSQDEGETELRAAQRAARQLLCTCRQDIVEFWRDVWRFARIVVAQIIEGNVNNELVNWLQGSHRIRLQTTPA